MKNFLKRLFGSAATDGQENKQSKREYDCALLEMNICASICCVDA